MFLDGMDNLLPKEVIFNVYLFLFAEFDCSSNGISLVWDEVGWSGVSYLRRPILSLIKPVLGVLDKGKQTKSKDFL